MEEETGPPDVNKFKDLKYLTIQDILWINLQVTKKVRHFNYAKLEEATFYQYGYGGSRDLARQSGRFLGGFLKLHPIDAGNEGTALVGCGAFLLLNGFRLNVKDDDVLPWLEEVQRGKVRAEEVLLSLLTPDESAHSVVKSDVRDAVRVVLGQFPLTLQTLATQAETRVAS